ncbi:MAG: hypothetical protein LBD73_02135 [Deferribacteraceae bacterium]|jgi:hypothetical protein|nr:hypothetical protein [Deferribacteraceae bacterium]
MNKRLLALGIILFLSACYAPPPKVSPIIEEDTAEIRGGVKILAAAAERHRNNRRLNISFGETTPPSVSADGDDLLIMFAERIFIPSEVSKRLLASAFPCKYQETKEDSVLRFRCPKEIVIYPEADNGSVDIIAQKKRK